MTSELSFELLATHQLERGKSPDRDNYPAPVN